MQFEHAKSDRIFSDLRFRWPRSSDFGPEFDDLGHQIFKSKKGRVSEVKDDIDGSKQLYNDP